MNNSWSATLRDALNVAASPSPQFGDDNIGVGATGSTYWAANIAAALANQSQNHTIILFNIGVNDFGIMSEAQWIADVESVADACHTRYPSALFYLMRPWKAGFDAAADTFAGYIDTVVAARSFCRLGPDERSWLKGADNGATNTTDGIHYSAAGQAACAAQWKTTLGF